MKSIFIIGAVLILNACGASLAQKDCADANWFERGKLDGSEGKAFSLLTKYEKQCKTYNVKVDDKQYIAGYMTGMRVYCTKENGYNDGIRSAKLVATCPKETEYFKGYEEGFTVYTEEKERRVIDRLTRPDADNGQRTGPVGGGG